MREYGFAAVQASQDAEAEWGTRRQRVGFWVAGHLPRPGLDPESPLTDVTGDS